jgi:hypothetical protein
LGILGFALLRGGGGVALTVFYPIRKILTDNMAWQLGAGKLLLSASLID